MTRHQMIFADHEGTPRAGTVYDRDTVACPSAGERYGAHLTDAQVAGRYPLTARCETCDLGICLLSGAATWGHIDPAQLFTVTEIDTSTGWERGLDNMQANPWTGTFTRHEAESMVRWREQHITRKYRYRIEVA